MYELYEPGGYFKTSNSCKLSLRIMPIRTYLQHPHPPSIWSRFWFPCSTFQQSKQIFIIPCFRCFTLSREFVSVLQISHFTMSYLPRSGSKLLLVEYFQPILSSCILSDVSYLMYLIWYILYDVSYLICLIWCTHQSFLTRLVNFNW